MRILSFPLVLRLAALAAAGFAAAPTASAARAADDPTPEADDASAPAATTVPEVVVTASRLGVGLPGASTTVISAERIRTSPAQTIPELLALEAGIQARDLFGGTAASRATIDIRGFGAVGAQNTLILVDGRRLNDIDLAAIDYASIPLASIERVEITRGSAGAVLYGDGAVGGVVNIITKAATDPTTGASAEFAYGSDVYRQVDLSARHTVEAFTMAAYGSYINGKGYRANNDLVQRNLVSELRYRMSEGDVYAKFTADDQRLGLPGNRRVTLTSTELEPDFVRRLADNPEDKAFQSGYSGVLGFTRRLGEGIETILDMGARTKDQNAIFLDPFGNSSLDTVLTTWSFTPRVNLDLDLAGFATRSILGLDYYYSDYDSNRRQNPQDRPIHVYDARQNSAALYLQNTVALAANTAFALGARAQYLDFSASDTLDTTAPGGAFAVGAAPEKDNRWVWAFNAGIDQGVTESVTVFGRAARSIRVPTIDERIGTVGGVSLALKPQRSWDVEGGARFEHGPVTAQASAYAMWLTNEIRLNPEGGGCVVFFGTLFCFGANQNLDDTRRYGVEATIDYRVLEDLTLRANLAYTRAQFVAGPFDGNDVPLVAPWSGSLGVDWKVTEFATLASTLNLISAKRYENDERNFQPKLPGYALWDMKIGGEVPTRFGAATWSAQVNNILDKEYFNFGVASSTEFGTRAVFPLPERTFLVRAGFRY